MPPSWMNNTDPNVDFDTKGRAYQVTLPFNPWWTNHLHPDGAIGVSYSDDLGRTWVTGNGGNYLDHPQPVVQDAGRGGRQAVGGRQPHPRQPLPGPCVRRLGGVQRLGHQGPPGHFPATAARASPTRSP